MLPPKGIRTRVMLIAALTVVVAIVTGGSLLIVRNRVSQHAAEYLADDLAHSVTTFQNLQRQRHEALSRENALLADLPSLKALMTTRDERTIADGALEFWKVSESDLFALADSEGHVLTLDTQGKPASPAMRDALQGLIIDSQSHSSEPPKHYLVADGRIFDFSVQPLYFGSEAHGTLLGYTISGYSVDHRFVEQISQASAVEATFIADARPVGSTLLQKRQDDLSHKEGSFLRGHDAPTELSLGGERYLATVVDLSAEAAVPLRLVVLKSLDRANRATREINRLVMLVGLAALVLGSILMFVLSRMITRPLELLAAGVRAFGFGDTKHSLPINGTQEVRELSAAFARMRGEIQETNRALLEAERLATIGRMASSVSHDLRHYLAAVYANAEFLSSSRLSEAERVELFADIQVAVHGTTELIDSLLIFSRTGNAVHLQPESILHIVEKSLALLRAHPDAEGVMMRVECEEPNDAHAMVDVKKMERALYNLLLNACQSARKASDLREVAVKVSSTQEKIAVIITDTGEGVSELIRGSLFEPFVSEGKQSGTGLGLTLAHAIAEEHGGAVELVSTRPGETVFRLSLLRNLGNAPAVAIERPAGGGAAVKGRAL